MCKGSSIWEYKEQLSHLRTELANAKSSAEFSDLKFQVFIFRWKRPLRITEMFTEKTK